MNREDARVVQKAFLDQHVERPERSRRDGVARRPVSEHRDAGGRFEHRLRAADVGAELRGRQVVDQSMRVAVTGHLVARRCNGSNKGWKPLCHPAQNEKGGRHVVIREELQDPVGVGTHPALELLPPLSRDHAIEDADVKVVLDVDGHRVHDRGTIHGAGCVRQCPACDTTVLTVSRMMIRSNHTDMCLT